MGAQPIASQAVTTERIKASFNLANQNANKPRQFVKKSCRWSRAPSSATADGGHHDHLHAISASPHPPRGNSALAKAEACGRWMARRERSMGIPKPQLRAMRLIV